PAASADPGLSSGHAAGHVVRPHPLVLASVASAMTKTEAKDLASAVNLTRADMPGYSQTATDIGQLSDDPTFTDCSGTQPGAQFVGFFPSKTFERGHQSIYSEVDVLKSAELVTK